MNTSFTPTVMQKYVEEIYDFARESGAQKNIPTMVLFIPLLKDPEVANYLTEKTNLDPATLSAFAEKMALKKISTPNTYADEKKKKDGLTHLSLLQAAKDAEYTDAEFAKKAKDLANSFKTSNETEKPEGLTFGHWADDAVQSFFVKNSKADSKLNIFLSMLKDGGFCISPMSSDLNALGLVNLQNYVCYKEPKENAVKENTAKGKANETTSLPLTKEDIKDAVREVMAEMLDNPVLLQVLLEKLKEHQTQNNNSSTAPQAATRSNDLN